MPGVIEMTIRAPRVLVVEDEINLRELLQDVIPDMGFPVTAVRSAEDALRVLQADPHDIMILDLQLPMMGGMELFERIRRDWPDLQVIVLTGFGDLVTAQRAIHLDVVDFLSKPCHLRNVELALDRARRRTRILPIPPPIPSDQTDSMTLAESEYHQIIAAIHHAKGNKKAAAEKLGISRRTLHYRLAHYRRTGHDVE